MLRGHKEIANWIESTLRVPLTAGEVCRYSKWAIDPLPVKRPWIGRQPTGRVFAWSHEVEAWVRRHFAPKY